MPNLSNSHEPKHAAVIVPGIGTRRLTSKKVGSRIDGWASGRSLALFLVLVGIATESFGATVVVRKDGTGDFTTINAALESLNYQDGIDDVVLIGPGVYDEQLLLKGNAGLDASAFPHSSAQSLSLIRDCYLTHVDHLTIQGIDITDYPVLTVNNSMAHTFSWGFGGNRIATLNICGNNISMRYLNIQNAPGVTNAITGQGSNIQFENCMFSSVRLATEEVSGVTIYGPYIYPANNHLLLGHNDAEVSSNNEYTFINCFFDGMSAADGSLFTEDFFRFDGYSDARLRSLPLLGWVEMQHCIAKNFEDQIVSLYSFPSSISSFSLGRLNLFDSYFSNFPGSSIVQSWGIQERVEVQRCIFADQASANGASWNGAIYMSRREGPTTPNLLVANNIFINCPRGLWLFTGFSDTHIDWKVYNNTFFGYISEAIRINQYLTNDATVTISNNIFKGTSGYGATIIYENSGGLSTFLINNLFDDNVPHFSGTSPVTEVGSIIADPNFESTSVMAPAAPGDPFPGEPFSLSVGSPAVDSGDNSTVYGIFSDVDGNSRIHPIDGTVDIGAQELGAGPPEPTWTPSLTPTGTPTIGPTPIPTNTPRPSPTPCSVSETGVSHDLGVSLDLLNEDFYGGFQQNGSGTANSRTAWFGRASGDSKYIAFWALSQHPTSTENGLFVVEMGKPSSWRRLTSFHGSPTSMIDWSPDGQFIMAGGRLVNVENGIFTQPAYVSDDSNESISEPSTTKLKSTNWLLEDDDFQLVMFPILPNADQDFSRTVSVVTDFPFIVDWHVISSDASKAAFLGSFPRAHGGEAMKSDLFVINNLQQIIGAPLEGGGSFTSTLAPTSLENQNIVSIRENEDGVDNFVAVPMFSGDGSFVFYTEDWNNVYGSTGDLFTDLNITDFDIMMARADGCDQDTRFPIPGNQVLTGVSHGGTRLLYMSGLGSNLRMYACTLEVTQVIAGATSGVNDLTTSVVQTLADPSGGLVIVPAGTLISFPPGVDQEITLSTPISPVEDPQLPPGVDGIAMVRDLGPSGTTFDPPIEVVLRYTDAEAAGLIEETLRVFIFNDSTGVFDIEVTDIIGRDLENNTITIRVSHFSRFAIGGQQDPGEPSASVEEWHRLD